ncbi:small heat shock protein IbpA-like [Procambarus clarkii]|uniref:small heat shock protein IbpA-like n=1 Tax=Procambarus clarkii TaxID=6728 RepID=UPI003743276C
MYNIGPLHKSVIGFNQLFESFENSMNRAQNYPPYNIVEVDNYNYQIQVAVAGFGESDLRLTEEADRLVINGSLQEVQSCKYIYRGLATRDFKLEFVLEKSWKVKGAELHRGILLISLCREETELQPKTIKISST